MTPFKNEIRQASSNAMHVDDEYIAVNKEKILSNRLNFNVIKISRRSEILVLPLFLRWNFRFSSLNYNYSEQIVKNVNLKFEPAATQIILPFSHSCLSHKSRLSCELTKHCSYIINILYYWTHPWCRIKSHRTMVK